MLVRRRAPTALRPAPTANPNRLLAALPAADYRRLAPTLELVPLKLKKLLHRPGEPIQHVYFPGGGFCSLLTVLADGNMVEVATIGREGMVGMPGAVAGTPLPSSVSMVQGETAICYRMTAAAFRHEMDRRGPFYELVTRFTHALVGFIMQSTACNAVHTTEQRLARWLLMARDRMGSNAFPLTHDFVAMMLGATRPTVTVSARALQQAGLITYRRGHVSILDARKLEATACECYRAASNLLLSVTEEARVR